MGGGRVKFVIVWEAFAFNCFLLVMASLATDYRAIGLGLVLGLFFLLFYYMVCTFVNLVFRIIMKFIKLPIYFVFFFVYIITTTIFLNFIIGGENAPWKISFSDIFIKNFQKYVGILAFFSIGLVFSLLKNCTTNSHLNRL